MADSRDFHTLSNLEGHVASSAKDALSERGEDRHDEEGIPAIEADTIALLAHVPTSHELHGMWSRPWQELRVRHLRSFPLRDSELLTLKICNENRAAATESRSKRRGPEWGLFNAFDCWNGNLVGKEGLEPPTSCL